MAYVLADQGHEVIIAGDDVTTARHPDILYVRMQGERLPFAPESFDVVVSPQVCDSAIALAEYARVLRSGGLLSTMSRTYDESIPWMRKLHAVVGRRTEVQPSADTHGLRPVRRPGDRRVRHLGRAGSRRRSAVRRRRQGPDRRRRDVPGRAWAVRVLRIAVRHAADAAPDALSEGASKQGELLKEPIPDTTLLDFT